MIEKTTTLHIRVPESLVKQIKAAAKESGTPMGIALKYLIEQDIVEVIESRITKLEEGLKNWVNMQVDTNATLALLNFRVAFLQDTLKVLSPFGELTEEQREKIWAGESGEAIKFVGETMRHSRKHYQDTKQTGHPSYKAASEFFEKAKEMLEEMLEGKSPTDEHIT